MVAEKIDGILSDMNDMSPETAIQLVSSAFIGYIMRNEKCTSKEAGDKMANICAETQKAIARAIIMQGGSH